MAKTLSPHGSCNAGQRGVARGSAEQTLLSHPDCWLEIGTLTWVAIGKKQRDSKNLGIQPDGAEVLSEYDWELASLDEDSLDRN